MRFLSGLARTLALTPLALAACGGSSAATTPSPIESGVTGRVLLGPTCPVERAGHPCTRGYEARVAVFTANGRHFVRSFSSTASGRFRVRLAPGRYRLQSSGGALPTLRPVLIAVHARRFTTITLTFDTGIR